MGPDIHGDGRFFENDQFDGHSVGKIYGNGVKRLQFSFQGMKPERWMLGVQFQEFEGFFVLADQVRMPLKELRGPFRISFGEDDFIRHRRYAGYVFQSCR